MRQYPLRVLITILLFSIAPSMIANGMRNIVMVDLFSSLNYAELTWDKYIARLTRDYLIYKTAGQFSTENVFQSERKRQVGRLLYTNGMINDRENQNIITLNILSPKLNDNNDRWLLCNVEVDTPALVSGTNIEATFTWVRLTGVVGYPSDSTPPPCSGKLSNMIENKLHLKNLLQNGNFEWFTLAEKSGLPSGFFHVYSSNRDYYYLQVINRQERDSSVLVLSGTGDLLPGTGGNSGVISSPILISKGYWYLFGGWVRPEANAQANIGLGWYRDPKVSIDQYIFPPVPAIDRLDEGEWKLMADLVTVPKDAEYARIWISNMNGQIEFDDVFLIEVHPPTGQ